MRRSFLWLVVLLVLAGIASGATRPRILQMTICAAVREEGGRFVPEGRRAEFTPQDPFVHCVIELWIPSEYERARISFTVTWYSPDGKAFQTERFAGLRRGRTYFLSSSLAVRGNEPAELLGRWRVCAAVPGMAPVCRFFEIAESEKEEIRGTMEYVPVEELYIPYDQEGAVRVDLLLLSGDRSALVDEVLWDTGADITHLPASVARELGIKLQTGRKVRVIGIEGFPLDVWLHYVQIEIISEGKCLADEEGNCLVLWIPVLFDERINAPKLLGRMGIAGIIALELQEKGAIARLLR